MGGRQEGDGGVCHPRHLLAERRKRRINTPVPLVRQSLRNATGDIHERMHRLEPFRLIDEAALDLVAYGHLLAGFARFHAEIGAIAREHDLERFSGALSKVELLRADLAFLEANAEVPTCTFSLPSRAHALGALYVAEGSMFGARVIARQLSYLVRGQTAGTLFFRGTREDAPRWKALAQELESNNGDPISLVAMSQGATMAFGLFEACLAAEGET